MMIITKKVFLPASASSEDNLLAQKLQRKEEQDAKYKEQKEFEKLQVLFMIENISAYCIYSDPSIIQPFMLRPP